MGLLGSIADTAADVVSGAADAAPIPGSDVLAEGIDTAQDVLGGGNGGGGGGGGGRGTPRTTSQRPSPMRNSPTLGGGTRGPGGRSRGGQTGGPPTGVQSRGMMNLPGLPPVGGGFSLTSPPTGNTPGGGGGGGQRGGQQQGGAMQATGNLPQLLFAEMMDDALSASSDVQRYFLESLQSGSIQNGFFTQPVEVQTPRGVEYHSPPGYRTVTINGQKVSVHGAVAKMMNLLPAGERTFREKADDAAREYLTMRRRWKDLASKFGFKSPKARKSGPKR